MFPIKIGLETHIQLNTKSKIFCGCKNPVNLDKEPEPNSLCCPACLGLPGSKPRANRKVIEFATKIALGLNSKINKEMFFSRKSYFYPDLSKNFQITQFEIPLASEGFLIVSGRKIRIRRIHVEEDPAKIIHVGGLGGNYTLIDYNRSGIPLVEVVTEPDIGSPQEARLYLQKLVAIMEYLGVYDSSSQAVIKSDANISLAGKKEHNRVEVKNITGTKDIEKALKYEIVRQKNILRRGLSVKRETRSWNPELLVTSELRGKEEEEEYGYIFEPDLAMIEASGDFISGLRKIIPELPEKKYQRFIKRYGIQPKISESIASDIHLANLFEKIARKTDPKTAANWISGYLKKTLNYHNLRFNRSRIKEKWIISLLEMFQDGKITDRNAEMVIRKMVEKPERPEMIIKKYGLGKQEIKDIEKIMQRIINKNTKAVKDYKKGEKKALHFIIGEGVKETKGQVDAVRIRKIIKKLLN